MNGFEVRFDDAELEHSVRRTLDSIEKALAVAVHSDDAFVSEAASHLVEAGGKRFRPLLCVLASHFGDPARPDIRCFRLSAENVLARRWR